MTDLPPAEKREESETQSQATGAQLLGCLVGLVVLAFIFLFLLASFTANPKADGSVSVHDEANVLSPWAKGALNEIRFPRDIPAVVRTVSSIPAGKIGAFATDLMPEEPHWQTLRPRGWLRDYIRQDSPSGRGVYVLVSLEPLLLQIRFGRDIRFSAYQEMLAVGSWYRDQQRFERSALDQHVVNTVKDLAHRMHRVADPPWPLSWAQSISSLVSSEIEDLLAPSDGLFSTLVVRSYIGLAHELGATGSAWRFVAFSVAAFVLLWLIGKKLLIDRFLVPRIKRAWLRWTVVILSSVGLLGVLVTGFASLAVLSKGRVEDELALEALGLSFLSTGGFDATLFSTRGGLWLAIPGALVSLLGEVVQAAEARKHGETTLTFGWVAWGCALFLLPKAIAIAALAILIWNTTSEIVQSASRDSTA